MISNILFDSDNTVNLRHACPPFIRFSTNQQRVESILHISTCKLPTYPKQTMDSTFTLVYLERLINPSNNHQETVACHKLFTVRKTVAVFSEEVQELNCRCLRHNEATFHRRHCRISNYRSVIFGFEILQSC